MPTKASNPRTLAAIRKSRGGKTASPRPLPPPDSWPPIDAEVEEAEFFDLPSSSKVTPVVAEEEDPSDYPKMPLVLPAFHLRDRSGAREQRMKIAAQELVLARRAPPCQAVDRLANLLERFRDDGVRGRAVLLGSAHGTGKTGILELCMGELESANKRFLHIQVHAPTLLAAGQGEERKGAILAELVKALHHAYLLELVRAVREKDAQVAEQLRMELLSCNVNTDRLEDRWRKLGAVPEGVLFPSGRRREERLAPRSTQPRAWLELSTLWQLNRAYMAISGFYQEKSANAQQAEDSRTLKIGVSAQDWLRPALSLATGGLLGQQLFAQPLPAAFLALATTFMVEAGFSYQSGRSEKQERLVEFTEQPSYHALSRWLPFLLQQLKELGLYPVFAVDELDPLQGDFGELLDWLTVLRGVVNEGAFFVFLVDRAGFVRLNQDVAPAERRRLNNLFSEQLFLSFHPADLQDFITGGGGDQDAAALLTFRARSRPMKLWDVVEGALWDSDSPDEEDGRTGLEIRYQRVVDRVLARYPWLRERPLELQIALELLYAPAEHWISGNNRALEPRWLEAHLRDRMLLHPDELLPDWLETLRQGLVVRLEALRLGEEHTVG